MRPQKAGWISLPTEGQVFATEQQPDCEDWGVFGAEPAQAGHPHAHKQLYPGGNSMCISEYIDIWYPMLQLPILKCFP